MPRGNETYQEYIDKLEAVLRKLCVEPTNAGGAGWPGRDYEGTCIYCGNISYTHISDCPIVEGKNLLDA